MTTVPKQSADRDVHSCGSEGTGRAALSEANTEGPCRPDFKSTVLFIFFSIYVHFNLSSPSLLPEIFALFCFLLRQSTVLRSSVLTLFSDTFLLTFFFSDTFSAAYLMSQRLLRHICLYVSSLHTCPCLQLRLTGPLTWPIANSSLPEKTDADGNTEALLCSVGSF